MGYNRGKVSLTQTPRVSHWFRRRTVGSATHGDGDAISLQKLLVDHAGVLTAAVRVMQQLIQEKADDLAGTTTKYDPQPAFVRFAADKRPAFIEFEQWYCV